MQLRISILAAGLVTLATLGVARAPEASLSFRVFGCTDCEDGCQFGKHVSTSNLDGNWELDVHSHPNTHGCTDGSCDDYHDTGCGISAQVILGWTGLDRVAVAEITDALEAASSLELPALVRKYGSALEFNSERGALQVIGCSGEVVANVPLSTMDLAVLTE
jgi:hypothetical protein